MVSEQGYVLVLPSLVCRTGLGLCGELGNRRVRISVQRRRIASAFSVQRCFVTLPKRMMLPCERHDGSLVVIGQG